MKMLSKASAHRLRQTAVTFVGALLMVPTVLAGSASAVEAVVSCGAVITENTTLAADVGPCPGKGIRIDADNITLNLNGHKVLGNPQVRVSPDKAGILLRNVNGVTVKNGIVEGFDAGVSIIGGSSNAVRQVTAQNNVNYRLVTGRDASAEDFDPENGPFCTLGDGITMYNSTKNVVRNNVVTGNGPYSGISLVGRSTRNVVSNNEVLDNDLVNQPPSGAGRTVCGGLVGELGPLGRLVQDVGVRIEGPGAQHNVVADNQIRRSALAGVMVTAFRNEFPMANNGFNQILNNSISQTGLRTQQIQNFYDEYHSSGIFLHNAGTTAVSLSYGNTIAGNNSSNNFGGGIEVVGPFPGSGEVGVGGNTIVGNVANNNVLDGIILAEGTIDTTVAGNKAHGNGLNKALIAQLNAQDPYVVWTGADGADLNAHCDDNHWFGNFFGTVNQSCVVIGGTGQVISPAAPVGGQVEAASSARRPEGGGDRLFIRPRPDGSAY